MDVRDIERIARESDASAGLALDQERILVSCEKV